MGNHTSFVILLTTQVQQFVLLILHIELHKKAIKPSPPRLSRFGAPAEGLICCLNFFIGIFLCVVALDVSSCFIVEIVSLEATYEKLKLFFLDIHTTIYFYNTRVFFVFFYRS